MDVLLASGGLDSTLLAAMLRPPVHLSVDYGQLHRREIDAARAVAAHYDAEHLVVDARCFGQIATSALTGRGGDLGAPVVPNRNAFLISIGAAVASSRGLKLVLIGCNAADAADFPDCRREFINAIDKVTTLATGVGVMAPLLDWDKAQIGRELVALKVPVELTWSCYRGGRKHCGKCGACLTRKEALGVHDH